MSSPVEQIKERLNIVDIVSSYLKLEKAGSNLRARCPFHNEKSPSFFVSPTRNSYHCFGCNRGGDIFTFVEEIEGVSFYEALKSLADKAGVQLTEVGSKENLEHKKSYELLELATKFFEFSLTKNTAVLEYLKKRGLEEKTIKNFRIGFAQGGWQTLFNFLKSRGFTDMQIEKNGLSIKGERGYYDRFRSRIMFPITDTQGRVVGYSGRIFDLPGSEASAKDKNFVAAKYVNSPETELYNKSKILFGYDKAKRAMMQKNQAIVVEGQMDLIMAHQAGTENTVAVSGTALTPDHIGLIKRFTNSLLLSFDSDEAGLSAGERGVKLALSLDMDVKMVKIPESLDPADIILKDKSIWEKAIKDAQPIIDFYLDYLTEKGIKDRDLVLAVNKKVLPYVAAIGNSVDQAHFIKKIANKLDLGEDSIREEVGKILKKEQKEVGVTSPVGSKIKKIKDQIRDKIVGIWIWQKGESPPGLDLDLLEKKYKQISGRELEEEIKNIERGEKENLVFQAEMYYENHKALKGDADELIDNLEKELLEERLSTLLTRLRQTEKDKDEKEMEEVLKKCQEISKRINEIKNSRFLEK